MRLGDLDAMATIESEAYMSAQIKLDNPITQGLNSVVHRKIQQLIADTPTIDAVPVVRCRECKHFNLITHECENELLSTDHEGGASYSLNFYDDDFCSYGELRETSHD